MRKIRLSKTELLAILFGVILIALSFWLAVVVRVDPEEAQRFIDSFGILGPVVFIISYILTIVVSPLAGTPFILAGYALFGAWKTFFLVYTSNLIGASINFFIARRFGRPAVRRLAGEKSIKKIDEIANLAGTEALIMFRLFGGGIFDFVSYAIGLTNIGFTIYFLITALCLLPNSLIYFALFQKALSLPPKYSIPIFVFLYLYSISVPALVYRHEKKKLESKKNQKNP